MTVVYWQGVIPESLRAFFLCAGVMSRVKLAVSQSLPVIESGGGYLHKNCAERHLHVKSDSGRLRLRNEEFMSFHNNSRNGNNKCNTHCHHCSCRAKLTEARQSE